jgi:hypothetical protein
MLGRVQQNESSYSSDAEVKAAFGTNSRQQWLKIVAVRQELRDGAWRYRH